MTRQQSILLSLLLALPVFLFLADHYFHHSPDLSPTGFTIDENILYMSYAHQYLDQENFSLFYSNPFDGDPASPKIYFQPVNFLFVALVKAGMDPGLCFSLFGLLMAVLCIYLGVRLIHHLLPGYKYQSWVALLFTWGGGLTAFTGIAVSLFVPGQSTAPWTEAIYIADPARGWWGLNWGRVLFIPLEAYYHFLFLLCVLLILKKKWIPAALAGLWLSVSHPFTGIEYLLILCGWIVLEKTIFRNKQIPGSFIILSGLTLAFHIYYYLVYLPSFPEHKLLFRQYSAAWTHSFRVFIPAYALVVLLSLFTIRLKKPLSKLLEQPQQRLFLAWAIVAFLLSKHEWFIKPMQPIHFTRGYVWAGLFLFSIPGLQWLLEYLKKNNPRKLLLALLVLLFLSDNILWITNILRTKTTTESESHITRDTRQVLDYLKKIATPNTLITGNATGLTYMANAYSAANAWVSHPYNTPDRENRILLMKKFLETGEQPAAWKDRQVLILLAKKDSSVQVNPLLKTKTLLENGNYVIFIP